MPKALNNGITPKSRKIELNFLIFPHPFLVLIKPALVYFVAHKLGRVFLGNGFAAAEKYPFL